jgi:hypothetical protein
MGKKTFRPSPDGDARYPRLGELTRGTWREWGLVAVGSLVLAAGCRRTKGEAVPVRPAPQDTSGMIQPLGGEPWPPRAEVDAAAPADAASPDVRPAITRPRGGVMRPHRTDRRQQVVPSGSKTRTPKESK